MVNNHQDFFEDINTNVKFVYKKGILFKFFNKSGWYIVTNKLKKGPYATHDIAKHAFILDRKQV